MIDLKMMCGGQITSVRNPDGTELLEHPVKNKWLDWGLRLISAGCAIDNAGALLYDLGDRAQFFSTYGLFYGRKVHLGSGAAPSTIDMTALAHETVNNANLADFKVTAFEIAGGNLHVRLTFTFGSSYTFREFGMSHAYYYGDNNSLLFRVVLGNSLNVSMGSALDYDFYLTLPYATRTVVNDLFGTGIPGEIWLRPAYTATKNNLMQSAMNGFPTIIDSYANASSPQGLMSHGYIKSSTGIYEKPMFSSDTSKNFPADGVGDAALPITCASATYEWVSHDQVNYAAHMRYVIPASAGAMDIAYGNIRSLAFRFGSYDASGNWIGQHFVKTAAQKLNVAMTYTFASM
ncbi:MAG: hypothetical protein WCS18_11230 [Sphaerochaetaceae bacterium]